MRLLAGLLFVMLIATLAMAQVQVEPVTSMPSWCGGSYSVAGGLDAKAYADAVAAGQALPSGTNFAVCEDVVKQVKALDGTMTEVRVPTHPAAPASQVGFEADGRVVRQTGAVDADGKAIVEELKLPAPTK